MLDDSAQALGASGVSTGPPLKVSLPSCHLQMINLMASLEGGAA